MRVTAQAGKCSTAHSEFRTGQDLQGLQGLQDLAKPVAQLVLGSAGSGNAPGNFSSLGAQARQRSYPTLGWRRIHFPLLWATLLSSARSGLRSTGAPPGRLCSQSWGAQARHQGPRDSRGRRQGSRDARAKTEDSRDARRWRGTTGAAASLASQMSYRGPVTCDGWPWVTSVWHQTSRGGHPSTRVGHVTARAGLGGSRAATRILQCLGPGTQLAKPQLHPGWPGSRPSGLPGWLGKSLWSATLART